MFFWRMARVRRNSNGEQMVAGLAAKPVLERKVLAHQRDPLRKRVSTSWTVRTWRFRHTTYKDNARAIGSPPASASGLLDADVRIALVTVWQRLSRPLMLPILPDMEPARTSAFEDLPVVVRDRRRLPDRRAGWRGGRRDTDWTARPPGTLDRFNPPSPRRTGVWRWLSLSSWSV